MLILCIVLIRSVVTFMMSFVLDCRADYLHGHLAKGLRSLGKAFMLLFGLAWEGAQGGVDTALKGFNRSENIEND